MAKSLEAWKKSVFNQKIDFDNASYDCVDVSKSWIMYLSGFGRRLNTSKKQMRLMRW